MLILLYRTFFVKDFVLKKKLEEKFLASIIYALCLQSAAVWRNSLGASVLMNHCGATKSKTFK
ncbi:hypothetical protein HMPREF1043_1357 [Streptococcus anginosus subsp. whileyi CCUG 39159]|uniref:Uncharacterized protein n=1 Tax=Streptococcus anginosus subsp. whileyi CCUG 39159 TaxID=1095729 RepID=I0SEA2_STRAP|nr:hypothetical protein HMPREF1043_1357 [Streptococcus anginosus subsp. whileyi CCUG 39159]